MTYIQTPWLVCPKLQLLTKLHCKKLITALSIQQITGWNASDQSHGTPPIAEISRFVRLVKHKPYELGRLLHIDEDQIASLP